MPAQFSSGVFQVDYISFLWMFADVKDAHVNEELVLNTVSTLNNLSFYNSAESVVQQRQVEITQSELTF